MTTTTCDCGDYGLFEVRLTDGRVFERAAIHGHGGVYRLARRSLVGSGGPTDPRRLLQNVLRDLERRQAMPRGSRSVVIYTRHTASESEYVKVTPDEVERVTFDDGEVRLDPIPPRRKVS